MILDRFRKSDELQLISLLPPGLKSYLSSDVWTVYEMPSQPILCILVKPSTSFSKLKECKTALQNHPFSQVWLLKASHNKWNRQSLLENEKNRCYFYKRTTSRKYQVFDQRKIPISKGKAYLSYPLSIDITRPYFNEGSLKGFEGDFSHRTAKSKVFAKTIEERLQSIEQTSVKSLLSKTTLKTLLQETYIILLSKLEG